MRISLIAAMTDQGIIGRNNQLPWHLPADLKHLKQLSLGKTIVMGRKTFESIGKPLPQRTHIIISRNADFQVPGCQVVDSISAAIKAAEACEELMIFGGEKIFEAFLPLADTLYLTLIHANLTGDTYFPSWDRAQWQEISRTDHAADAQNPYDYSFVTLARKYK